MDVAPVDAPVLDVVSDTSPDATTDVPADSGPSRCTADNDCASSSEGPACDTATGRCVSCTATSDRCPTGQYCVGATNRCAEGCRDDAACMAAGDGGAGAGRCDPMAHRCVECVTDDHCAAGSLCVGNLCVAGCSATRACPSGQTCCAGGCVDVQSNTAHCGACDARCMVANAMPACMNGRCSVGACTAPFADCDMDPSNGCETSTQTSVNHCGGCGMACGARPSATASCAAGRCVYECAAGFADCDMEPSNGCEVDTRTSLAHCGACGRACAPPNATAACAMGTCQVAACAEGFGDCDMNASNGCEVDVRAAASHCGMCGSACPSRPNALSGCATSRCVLACLAGFADCDGMESTGCEVDTRTSLAHCGGCGRSCSAANGTASCEAGACRLAMCNAGFADCDTNVGNGCEVNTGSDAANCGMCGNRCSSGVCGGGVCQPPSCTDRVRNGTETDVDCGGTCPRCDLCRACAVDADCTGGTCSGGRCTVAREVRIDWLTNCRGPGGGNVDVSVAGLPAGSWRVTALPSAGTVWNPVVFPSTGWLWNITCENLAVPSMATPSGVLYPTPEAAFAALPVTSATVNFAGGTLLCYFSDNPCSDNQGSVRFRIERVCPAM